jgi:hypothetical protein
MPYVRIWITEYDREMLLQWAQEEEDQQAQDEERKPKRVTLKGAVMDCFLEGLADLEIRR